MKIAFPDDPFQQKYVYPKKFSHLEYRWNSKHN
jgi:hypothetical protein